MAKIYVGDFESANAFSNINNNKTWVWLYDLCDIENFNHITGQNIAQFFHTIEKLAPATIYFHNAKFDFVFILDYLLKNQYEWSNSKKLKINQFKTLITNVKVFYSIKVKFKNGIIEFRDSSKKIPGSVEEIAKSYKLPILKGEIDYMAERPIDYFANETEIAYIKNDTEIIARVLKIQYDKNLTHLTTSSDTMNLYKEQLGDNFRKVFPVLDIEIDNYIRHSYRGGVVQVSNKYKEKLLNNIYVYDINSMYPAQLNGKNMPYGTPKYFKGKYTQDELYNVYIARICVCCKLKDGYQPTILLNKQIWLAQQYLLDTNFEMVELTLTSVDIDLLFKHYDIFDIKYVDGYKFKSNANLFKKFISPLYEGKCNSEGAERNVYKLLLNAIYGKFATNPKHQQRYPLLINNTVAYALLPAEFDKPVYTAVSAFVTAYSRQVLFDAIQNNYDSFVYCDTDSVHLTTQIVGAEVHPSKLGAFKLEKVYIRAKYLAQKSYFGETEDKKDLKLAGCPKNVKRLISLNNFDFGNTFDGKLMPRTVDGGVLLVPTTFTIKKR